MELDTIDVGHIELYLPGEVEYLEEHMTYVESWDTPIQELAYAILQDYLATTGKTEEVLDDADISTLDALVFSGYEL